MIYVINLDIAYLRDLISWLDKCIFLVVSATAQYFYYTTFSKP